MTSATPIQPAAADNEGRPERFVQRRPVTAFLLLAFGIGLPGLAIPLIMGLPAAPFLLLLVFVALLGSAVVVTRLADGPGAVRRLLSRVLIWRFSVGRWAVILLGMPALVVALAAASGTLRSPERGWAAEVGLYLFNTLIFGALTINIWEETAWAGFAQTRLMARHGLLVGSLVTAVFFAAIHVPLQFEGNRRWSEIAVDCALLFAATPVYRYLLGMHLLDTRGSILAAGIQHASWNAAQNLNVVEGGDWEWQTLAAVALLAALVAIGRRLWRPESRPIGREAEKAAAAGWMVPSSPRARSEA
jgi:membrane protease YdiL (CAAX protease family)